MHVHQYKLKIIDPVKQCFHFIHSSIITDYISIILTFTVRDII